MSDPAVQPMSLEAASEAMKEAMRTTVRRNRVLFLIQAVIMVLAGVAALIYPLISTVALALFLGWMLIFAGIAQAITLIGGTKVPHFWMQLLSAALSVIVGFLFIRNPAVGVGTLALLLIAFFLVSGIAKIYFSLTVRPLANWGWVLASGVLGVLLAIFLIANPALSLFFLGIFVGVQLIAEGVAIGWMAWNVGKADAG